MQQLSNYVPLPRLLYDHLYKKYIIMYVCVYVCRYTAVYKFIIILKLCSYTVNIIEDVTCFISNVYTLMKILLYFLKFAG